MLRREKRANFQRGRSLTRRKRGSESRRRGVFSKRKRTQTLARLSLLVRTIKHFLRCTNLTRMSLWTIHSLSCWSISTTRPWINKMLTIWCSMRTEKPSSIHYILSWWSASKWTCKFWERAVLWWTSTKIWLTMATFTTRMTLMATMPRPTQKMSRESNQPMTNRRLTSIMDNKIDIITILRISPLTMIGTVLHLRMEAIYKFKTGNRKFHRM